MLVTITLRVSGCLDARCAPSARGRGVFQWVVRWSVHLFSQFIRGIGRTTGLKESGPWTTFWRAHLAMDQLRMCARRVLLLRCYSTRVLCVGTARRHQLVRAIRFVSGFRYETAPTRKSGRGRGGVVWVSVSVGGGAQVLLSVAWRACRSSCGSWRRSARARSSRGCGLWCRRRRRRGRA